jgi:hypothetical protein
LYSPAIKRGFLLFEAAMSRKIASETEFEIGENQVRHVPTNATFYAHDGQEEISSFLVGHMGSVLPNGDDYEEDSIKAIAARLMIERLKK